MANVKIPLILGGAVALLILAGLVWNYTEAIKAKNVIEMEKIESTERLKTEEMRQEQEEASKKHEQEDKEFAAKRKADCLKIYEKEDEKWNNVRSWRYEETTNECFIRYKEPEPKSDEKCEELYPAGEGLTLWWKRSLCKEGEFEKTF